MDIYKESLTFLADIPTVRAWPEMWAILERLSSGKPPDWQLPVLGCEAVGGRSDQAITAIAATACMLISIVLIDDMLDSDPRGEYWRIGTPATANLAAVFQAVGMEAIARSDVRLGVKMAVFRSLIQMLIKTGFGQYMDAQNPAEEKAYWQLIQTKSSPFFGTALHIGALLGGASNKTAEKIKQVGYVYGEMIQIHDDLNDSIAVPANPDWTIGRSPLPILYAKSVEHPDQVRFLELRPRVSDPDLLEEAQSILIRCGAVSYCVDQLIHRYKNARDNLADISLAHRDILEDLLDDVIKPVKELCTAIGLINQSDLPGF